MSKQEKKQEPSTSSRPSTSSTPIQHPRRKECSRNGSTNPPLNHRCGKTKKQAVDLFHRETRDQLQEIQENGVHWWVNDRTWVAAGCGCWCGGRLVKRPRGAGVRPSGAEFEQVWHALSNLLVVGLFLSFLWSRLFPLVSTRWRPSLHESPRPTARALRRHRSTFLVASAFLLRVLKN